MKYFLVLLITLIPLSANAGIGPAPIITSPSTSTTDNHVYAGLKWTLGESMTPKAVVGFNHARIDSNGDTDGADISFSFGFVNGLQADTLRAKYFDGQESLQGEVGAGFDFTHGFFVGLGAKAPFINIGADYIFTSNPRWQPYFILDTQKKHDKPKKRQSLTCPPNSTLINNERCRSDIITINDRTQT